MNIAGLLSSYRVAQSMAETREMQHANMIVIILPTKDTYIGQKDRHGQHNVFTLFCD